MLNLSSQLLKLGLKNTFGKLLGFQKCDKNVFKLFLKTANSKAIASSLLIILVLSAICDVADACSSRIISRPRPRTTPEPSSTSPTSPPRPNITFHTYKCPDIYATWYCLNSATCFAVKIGVEVLYNCECKDGYIGPRCDYKDLDGSYLAGRSRVMLETASIAGGAVAAILLFTIIVFIFLKKHSKRSKFEVESQQTTDVKF